MKITILGSGTSLGVPIIGCSCPTCMSEDSRDKRLRTSVFVQHNSDNILIDIGPDFRNQFISNNLSTVDAILLTHEHHDHVGGLDDIRPINFLQRKVVPVYGPSRVLEEIKKRFHYAFDDGGYPGTPKLSLHPTDDKISLPHTEVDVLEIWHGQLKIAAYRIGRFAYITDANKIPPDVMEKLSGLHTLIINALRHEKHYSHFTLKESLEVIQNLKPDRAFITHISHDMGLTGDWEQKLPANVFPAIDGLELYVE